MVSVWRIQLNNLSTINCLIVLISTATPTIWAIKNVVSYCERHYSKYRVWFCSFKVTNNQGNKCRWNKSCQRARDYKFWLTSTGLVQLPRKKESMYRQLVRMFHKRFIYPVHFSYVSASVCIKTNDMTLRNNQLGRVK